MCAMFLSGCIATATSRDTVKSASYVGAGIVTSEIGTSATPFAAAGFILNSVWSNMQ